MATFQYDSYRNPNVGSILDLLRERGAIDASAAERIAGVRANADMQRGNAWAGAIREVAQVPGRIMEASRARKDQEQKRQILIAGEVGRLAARSNGNAEIFKAGVSELTRMGIVPQEMSAHIFQQVDTDGPSALQKYALFGEQVKQAVKTRPVDTVQNGVPGTMMVPEDDQGFYPAPPPEPKATPLPTEASLAAAAAAGDTNAAKALEALQAPTMAARDQAAKNAEETTRHNTAMERIGAMGAGRADAAQEETARHNRAMEENARNTKVGRPVIAGNAEELADFDTSLDDLSVLRATIAPIDSKTGKPVPGVTGVGAQIGAAIPAWATDLTGWGTDAKKKQALIDRVKQVIGKTLEGGVLRKEDELKYEKILPTVKDTSELVISKLAGLEEAIAKRKARRLDALEDAGYDVSRYRQRMNNAKLPDPDGIR